MTSYTNGNSEKYIREKDVKWATLIKAPKPENLDPVMKLDDQKLQKLLKKKKRPQDIAIDNNLERDQDKVLDSIGPLSKLWAMIYLIREKNPGEK